MGESECLRVLCTPPPFRKEILSLASLPLSLSLFPSLRTGPFFFVAKGGNGRGGGGYPFFSPPGVCRPSGFSPPAVVLPRLPPRLHTLSQQCSGRVYARQEAEEEERGHNIGLASLAPLRVIG